MISSKVVRTLPLTALAFVLTSASGACASKAPAPTVSTASQVQVDQTEIVSGVDDNGRDPAVVALDVGADSLCSGTLIAPDVLLTARHCVSITADTIAVSSPAVSIWRTND